MALIKKLLHCALMALDVLRLKNDFIVMVDAQPSKTVLNRDDSFRCRAPAISVFYTQATYTTVVTRKKPIKESSAGATNMQKSGRRRRETGYDGHETPNLFKAPPM